MTSVKELGLGFALLSIFFTLAALGSACMSLNAHESDDVTPWMWIGTYSTYIFLNVFLFARMIKNDLNVIILWFPFTIVLFLFRLFCIDKYQYGPFYVFTNSFIGASIVIMPVVYFILRRKKSNERARPVPQTVSSTATTNRTGARTKPARSFTPTVSRPTSWRENRYYAESMENRARHEYPRLGWLPDLYPDSNVSFTLGTAPETSTAATGDNQCNSFDFNCRDDNDKENCCVKDYCCDKDNSCDNAADGDGGGVDCGSGNYDCGGGDSGGGGGDYDGGGGDCDYGDGSDD